jgi:hypothetical protein
MIDQAKVYIKRLLDSSKQLLEPVRCARKVGGCVKGPRPKGYFTILFSFFIK